MKSYGETIKEIRRSKGLRLKEIADEQVSLSLLSQFENNKSTISCERFHRVLAKLEVSFEEFLLIQTEEHHSATQIEIMDYLRDIEVHSLVELEGLKKCYNELLQFYQKNYSLELDHFLELLRFDYGMKEAIFNGVPLAKASPACYHYLDGTLSFVALLESSYQKEPTFSKNPR